MLYWQIFSKQQNHVIEDLLLLINRHYNYSERIFNCKFNQYYGGISITYKDLGYFNNQKPIMFTQIVHFLYYQHFSFISLMPELYSISYFLQLSNIKNKIKNQNTHKNEPTGQNTHNENKTISLKKQIIIGKALNNIFFEKFYEVLSKIAYSNNQYEYLICVLDEPLQKTNLINNKTISNQNELIKLKEKEINIMIQIAQTQITQLNLKDKNRIAKAISIIGKYCLLNNYSNIVQSLKIKNINKFHIFKKDLFKKLDNTNDQSFFMTFHNRKCFVYKISKKKIHLRNKKSIFNIYQQCGIELSIKHYGFNKINLIAEKFLEFLFIIE